MKKTDLQGYRKNLIRFLAVFMVLFPWITYLNLSRISEIESTVFVGYGGVLIDFFIKQKSTIFIGVTVICLLWFVGERFLPEKVDNNVPLFKGKNKWLFILSGIFVVGTVISTLFSNYQANAFVGSPTVGEGLWVLLGYVVVILAFYNYFYYDYSFDMLKMAVLLMSAITVVLTFVEWFYKPLLEIGFVQALVAPVKYAEIVASMEASVFKSAISLTFYNPGYYGGFICIILPFVLNYFLQAKKVAEKVLCGVLASGLIFGIVASNTTTALYIAIVEIVLVLIGYVILGCTSKGKLVLIVAGAGVALLLSGVVTGNTLLNVFSNSNSSTGEVVNHRFEIQDIQMQDNKIVLTGNDAELTIMHENSRIYFLKENGELLKPAYVNNEYVFTEPEYADLKVAIRSATEEMQDVQFCLLVDAGYQNTVDFFVMESGEFAGIGQNLAPLKDISDAGTPDGLKSFYGLFTGRGYAWVNSLPILKETLLIGKGPGNFAYYFKQFDYVGLLDTHKTVKQVIDKPHSAYIQYATEVGLPAAIAFFGIFVGALIKAIKVFWKNKKVMQTDAVPIAAMVSVVGFLVYSIINDSMITVTPIACMIVGVLLASCYKIENGK